MKYLLDTHTLLWFLEAKPALSTKARMLIESGLNDIFISNLSFFEIAIKMKIGKLEDSSVTLDLIIKKAVEAEINILPLYHQHTQHYEKIPLYETHRDPFDRMILATALAENMTIITKDEKFDLYKDVVNIVW